MEKTFTDTITKELSEFKQALEIAGVSGALGYLNRRTPHRYTGIFRYDGDILRNIALFDKYDPELQKGEDAPLAATFCSLLISQDSLELTDSKTDDTVKGKINTSVISYCGVAMEDSEGKPFGSLCHYDMKRCQERIADIPLLQSASKLLYQYLFPKSS